ncbi:MAG: hypothetical protein ACP5MB_08115 [bacterium]
MAKIRQKELVDIETKLPKGMYGELLMISDRDGVSVDDLLAEIVEDYFEGDEPEDNPEDNLE